MAGFLETLEVGLSANERRAATGTKRPLASTPLNVMPQLLFYFQKNADKQQ